MGAYVVKTRVEVAMELAPGEVAKLVGDAISMRFEVAPMVEEIVMGVRVTVAEDRGML